MKKNHMEASNINGLLIIDKPKNLTSRDVVNHVSKILGTKKVGHTGTLDPLATGVLVLTIGKFTKLSDVLTSKTKEYVATFTLGFETDTLDITGTVTKRSDKSVEKKDIITACLSFIGTYDQEVPLYSAVKIKGRRLYDYARNDRVVELPKRKVTIENLEVLSIKENTVTIKCLVSKGTYIRSLIRDIGASLDTYATMTSLRRTQQGKFSIDNSYTLEDIKNNDYNILSLTEVLDNLDVIDISDVSLKRQVENGVQLSLEKTSDYILFKDNNIDIALYRKVEDIYKMFIKLN